jgi:hypothetical protein
MSPLGEAELAGADDVAKWFVEVMTIEQGSGIVEDTEEQTRDDEGSTTQGMGGSKTVAKESTELEPQATKSLDGGVEKLTLSEKP